MKKTKQFTIIEMLVVLAIISLIVGMLLTGIGIARESARETRAKAEMQQIKMAVTQYKSTFKDFPSTADNIVSSSGAWDSMISALNGTNKRNQSFLKGNIKETPWGKDYTIVFDTDWNHRVDGNDDGDDEDDEDVADILGIWCEDKDGDIINTWE